MYFQKVTLTIACILLIVEIATALPIPDDEEGSKETDYEKDSSTTTDSKELASPSSKDSAKQQETISEPSDNTDGLNKPASTKTDATVKDDDNQSSEQSRTHVENAKLEKMSDDKTPIIDSKKPVVKTTVSPKPQGRLVAGNRQTAGNQAVNKARITNGDGVTRTDTRPNGSRGMVSIKSGSKQTDYASDETALVEQLEPMLQLIQNGMTKAHRQPQTTTVGFASPNRKNGAHVNEVDQLLKISRQLTEVKQMLIQLSMRQGNIEDAVFHVAKHFPAADY